MAGNEQLQHEKAQLRDAIERIQDVQLKVRASVYAYICDLPAHMLQALDAFDAQDHDTTPGGDQSSGPQSTQRESDRDDPIVIALRAKNVKVKHARDVVFLAVHGLILESGFQLEGDASAQKEFELPSDWDANSGNGLFTATYRHPNDLSIKFELQGLFVGNKFEVYISDDKEHTHSIELSVDDHAVATSTTTSPSEPKPAASLLQNMDALRLRYTPFIENIVPKKKEEPRPVGGASSSVRPPPGVPTSGGDDRDYPPASPLRIPPVGSGDVFPPSIGGGDPGMLVGPDHALFGRRHDPTRGPVPGSRFDPYGPPIDPLGMPGYGRPRPQHPAPSVPFGEPNPDHLRMPRDDDMNFGFGQPPGRGSRGGDSYRPFGSDHSFF
ncbi:Fbxo7/pi31 domain, partial [Globisporangium splendens]